MLPKVATHILHHSSRAAAVSQNQTSQTIRNVLQFQSSNGTGSNSGSTGPKFTHSGTRFYKGPGRAVVHANAITTNDAESLQTDDSDDLLLVPRAPLPLTVVNRTNPRSDKIPIGGVLKLIQIHVRSKHTFARAQPPVASSANPEDLLAIPATSTPKLVRRNSNASLDGERSRKEYPEASSRRSPTSSPRRLDSTDPSAPQTVSPPGIPSAPTFLPSALFEAIQKARNSDDPTAVFNAVSALRASPTPPNISEYNTALLALHETRRSGDRLAPILDLYNDMLTRGVPPSPRTYTTLILALTDRDHEVHKTRAAFTARSKRLSLSDRIETAEFTADSARDEVINTENNFPAAMALFEALVSAGIGSTGTTKIPAAVYTGLLRSACHHSNVDAALHVFAQLERRNDLKLSAQAYAHLLGTYTNVNDLPGAEEVFKDFNQAVAEGKVASGAPGRPMSSVQLLVWNKMIEAYFRAGNPGSAIQLLEKMMDAPTPDPASAADSEVPPPVPSPASSTFTAVIAGFCHAGDVTTALAWFDRLLQQKETARHPFDPSSVPHRPDQVAWIVMIDALAYAGDARSLVRLVKELDQCASRDALELRAIDRILVVNAVTRFIRERSESEHVDRQEARGMLDFAFEILSPPQPIFLRDGSVHKALGDVLESYLVTGEGERAVEVLVSYTDRSRKALDDPNSGLAASHAKTRHAELRSMMVTQFATLLTPSTLGAGLSFGSVLSLTRAADTIGVRPGKLLGSRVLRAYAAALERGDVRDVSLKDYEMLAWAAAALEIPGEQAEADLNPRAITAVNGGHPDTAALLEDFARQGVDVGGIDALVGARIVAALSATHGRHNAKKLLISLGPRYQALLGVEAFDLPAQDSVDLSPVRADGQQSRYIDEFFPVNHSVSALDAYSRFEEGAAKGVYPHTPTIGRLINALGRKGDRVKVDILYKTAQCVLAGMSEDQEAQMQAWAGVEDQMVIACAHAGDLDAAHVHRVRLLEHGSSPTADAYGVLIQCVRDTTDDTASALALFEESRARGVAPNIYLYNNIISKLAKARKAEYALELFQQMKTVGVQPSSITYGAVIAACARVGDAHSAEMLFVEMAAQRNFKARIPPFNTMMQLYTQTKPDRARALHYYGELKKAGIHPSEHTYKLLLDTYGTIEPVDVEGMERVFQSLVADKLVKVQGTHWASLVNAYGCVGKNLKKAVAVFDSIPSPEAVTFEAIINVLVTHRRTDLIPTYVERLSKAGIHMTAYIANFLIKGYAAAGDLTEARAVFENLADAPEGVAAPHNHAENAPAAAPVYREPSTWEVMVRAELGAGHRERAISLLERLQQRKYPVAVFNRISGIMHDDSTVSPWASDSTPSPSSSIH